MALLSSFGAPCISSLTSRASSSSVTSVSSVATRPTLGTASGERHPGNCSRLGPVHVLRPATTLTITAMITTSKTKDMSACRSAVIRTSVVCSGVSDTWNVIPMVKAR